MQRRELLRSAAGLASVAAVGSTAGCLDSAPFIGSSSGPLGAIPADADALMYANIDVIREDEGVETLTNAYLDERSEFDYYEGPEDFDEVLEAFEDEADIDPTKLHEITAFSEFGGSDYETFAEYGGAIVNTDLTAEKIKDSLENADNIDFEEAEYSGSVVYEPEAEGGPWVGALPSGEVVVGTEDAVHDAIDFSPLEDIDTVAGTVYRDGDTRGLELMMNAEDESAAEDVAEMLNEVRDEFESETNNGDAEAILEDITIEQNGSSVTSSIERTISELEALIEDA